MIRANAAPDTPPAASAAPDDDLYVVIERDERGYRVHGRSAARIDHPWPRDPASSDVFAEWQWDGETLRVRNDRWGFQPLF
jgi:hypothetical protein